MVGDTHCSFCHNATATGCEMCNPNLYGKVIIYDDPLQPPNIYEEIEKIKERLDRLEKKNV